MGRRLRFLALSLSAVSLALPPAGLAQSAIARGVAAAAALAPLYQDDPAGSVVDNDVHSREWIAVAYNFCPAVRAGQVVLHASLH